MITRERLDNMATGYREALNLLRAIIEADARGQGVQYSEALGYARKFLLQEGVHVSD
jgi:DNA-directed RNA polymerase subunit F